AIVLTRLLANRAGPREGRLYAVWGLAELGPDHAAALVEALNVDTDPGVLQFAAGAVAGLGVRSREVGQALLRAVGLREPEVRVAAATALGRLGLDGTTLPGILRALESKDQPCRAAVLNYLPPVGAFVKDPP